MAPNTVTSQNKVNKVTVHKNDTREEEKPKELVSSLPKPLDKVKVERQTKEIFYDGYLYDVTNWIDRHPGGGIIKFYAHSGEDATVPIQQFHRRSSGKVMGIMRQFKKRPAQLSTPQLDPQTLKRHEALTKDFMDLYKQVEEEGLFEPSLSHTIYRLLELKLLFFIAAYLLFPSAETSMVQIVVGILVFAVFGARCGFVGHEAGHRSLTGNPRIDRIIHTYVYGFGVGLSGSAWNSHHQKHHSMPQRLDRDKDLETMPLLAFNEKLFENMKNSGNFFLRNQAILSFTVDTFIVILIWKFWHHPLYALKHEKYLDLLCMFVHSVYVFLFIGFWPYVFSVWLGSIYLFGNYLLSHSHMPVTKESLHWVEYAFCHTQNINSSWLIDWWMGYLNFQIEHHLFPTMPQFRNKLVKKRAQALAQKYNLPYPCQSYLTVITTCLKSLQRVADHLKDD